MSEPITNAADAVRELGALPVSVGPGRAVLAELAAALDADVKAENETLKARIAELEAERRKYVGVEPTIAEEMAYLSRCLDSVLAFCDEQDKAARLFELPTPEWIVRVRAAAEGLVERSSYPPALPWAHAMDDGDLSMFLDDMVSAALGRWRSGPEVPDRTVLADIEKVCADWRTPGEGLRSDEPEAADAVTQVFAPVASPREADVTPQVKKLRSLLAGQRAALEDPHDSPLHHSYRLGHDLPETGGTR